jgi:hypothetical protein
MPLAGAIALVLGLAALPALAQDPMMLRQQAREAAWAGRTAQALHLLEQHLAEHPDDRAARMDRARWLAWRGDYAGSIEALDAMGGDDAEARALRARVQAWAGRRDAALVLNTPLYAQGQVGVQAQAGSAPVDAGASSPDPYDIAWTQALAERLGERPERALAPLAKVEQLQPGSKDTVALTKAVRLPLYSYVGAPASVYSDSDDIEIRGRGLETNLRVSDAVRLLADVGRRTHEAPGNSPFSSLFGGTQIDERRVLLGARIAPTPDMAFEIRGGRSELDFADGSGDGAAIGRLAFSHRATDTFSYTIGAERDRVAYSPRALSYDVMRNGVDVAVAATPTLRDTIAVRMSADNFSDGNDRRAAGADWRHAMLRSDKAQVDVGVEAEWLGYTASPGTGYYSPDNYRRIAPMVSSYIAFGPEVGLYLSAALGVQRDESFSGWKRATDASASLTLGIFGHWQLMATGGYSERLNEFGKYTGHSFGLQMRYRFCEFSADRCP